MQITRQTGNKNNFMEKRINLSMHLKLAFFAMLVLSFTACKKTSTLVDVPSQAHFAGETGGSYFITGATVTKKIAIGLTNVSNVDRTITFTVTSPTGAVAGTHYNIVGGNTKTIAAGKALDSITVAGVYSQYLAGRKDTLIFTITDGSETKASTYNATYKLYMRGPCSDVEIVFSQMLGSYTKTFENGSYGPYTTTITNFNPINATSGTATITNIYDSGINGVATFNWSTVGNFTVLFAPQPSGIPGFSLRSPGGTPGRFTYCINTFTIPLELYTSGGTYDSWIMTMAR